LQDAIGDKCGARGPCEAGNVRFGSKPFASLCVDPAAASMEAAARGVEMDEKVERTLKEIEQRIERLRAGLADLSEAHSALRRWRVRATKQNLRATSRHAESKFSELERKRATAGADRLTES
jgi:septation ring formation regulator EzrA